jgi:uncharacterized protein (TIGR03790 family)
MPQSIVYTRRRGGNRRWALLHTKIGLALLFLNALALASPAPVLAQTGRQVLLVINSASDDSRRIGERYAASRDVPADQVVRLDLPLTDEISSRDFQQRLERPLAAWFTKTGAQDRILYIVLTRGVPLRIAGTSGLEGTVASVDSELTLLYRRLTGRPAPIPGRIDNPYYLGDRPIAAAQPFTHESYDIFLVSRLDGFSVEDVLGLIERGKTMSAPRGTFVLDMKATLIDRGGDAWLRSAAARLRELGFGDRVVLDESADVVTNQSHVLGYYSWGSNDPAIHQRTFNLTFEPGALAGMYVSTDGRTFAPPPDTWQIGSWEKRDSYYAGSPQSLAGDLIHAGVTGIAAHVAEPYLDATIRPQILFPAYVRGLNLVESFYLAMPYLSWQTVVIGDPLCVPFSRAATQSLMDPPIDTTTDLPPYFAARRIEVMAGQTRGMKPEGLRFALQGETRLAHGDQAGARQALEAAVMAEPRLDAANRTLAELYEKDGQFEKAVDRYRRVLVNSPNDVIALNNLAFCLAVRMNKPKEGLPQAQRAYTLSNGAPLIADTYGWLLHLTGDHAQALGILQFAAGGAPAVGEVRFHYAAVLAVTGDRATAQRELTKALELDPSLKSREDVLALQRTLGSPSR